MALVCENTTAQPHSFTGDQMRLWRINSKYQMHYNRLRELASPSNLPHFPPLLINEDTPNKSSRDFLKYLKLQFIKSYLDVCTIMNCFVCENSN